MLDSRQSMQKELNNISQAFNLIMIGLGILMLFYLLCLYSKACDFVFRWHVCVSCLFAFVLYTGLVFQERDKKKSIELCGWEVGRIQEDLQRGEQHDQNLLSEKLTTKTKVGFASQKGTKKTTKHKCVYEK